MQGPKIDFEAIDKEIEADKVAQVAQAAAGEDPPALEKGNDAPPAQFYYLLFFFLGCPASFGAIEQFTTFSYIYVFTLFAFM